jgi:hypothetical protein
MATAAKDPSGSKGGPREREQSAPKHEPGRSAESTGIEQIIFTMRAPAGEVIKLEKIDVGGNRRELSKEEIANLAGENEGSEIEDALDEAFEAGISSLLDPIEEEEEEESPETGNEVALRRELLTLIVGAGVRRRLQRRIVGRLLLSRAASR